MCSPSLAVEAVVLPPVLTVPPGTSSSVPGVFKSMYGMVRVVDLRVRFGVDATDIKTPGRIIIAEVTGGYAGFWVDEIEDVIEFPEKGWSKLPAHVPKEVFSRALIRDEGIRLYADLEGLDKFKSTGYLRSHIENIKASSAKNITSESDVKNKINISPTIAKEISIDTPLSISPQLEHVSDNSEKPIATSDDNSEFRGGIADDSKIKNYKDSLSSREIQHSAKSAAEKKSAYIKSSASNGSRMVARPPVADKQWTKAKPGGAENIPVSQLNIAHPEMVRTNSNNSIEAAARNKQAMPDYATNDSGLLWVSVSLLGLLAVAIYIIEFSDIFVVTKKDVEVTKTHESPAYEEVKISNTYIEKNNKVEEDNTDALGSFASDKVKISKTNEEFVIEINDFQDAEGTDVLQSENIDKRNQGALPVAGEEEYDTSMQAVSNEVSSAVVMQDEKTLRNKVYLNKPDDEGDEQLLENNVSLISAVVGVKPKAEPSDINPQVNAAQNESDVKTVRYIHIVVKGDTLWHIAKRYVNNPWKYTELARLSKIKNPDLIYPGQKVVVIHRYKE